MKKYLLVVLMLCLIVLRSAGAAEDNPLDAVAIRVMPNVAHLSPLDWYRETIDTKGAPQSLVVDGYEAVRDGRTVYVAGANVIDNKLYTNIYIISYNQKAEEATVDIFGQILKYWKFNLNIDDEYGQGVCRGAMQTACLSNDDCAKTGPGYVCRDNGCVMPCRLTSDCLANLYCDSQKSGIVRDVKRMAELGKINLDLRTYNDKHGNYPELLSGSYLPSRTISVWPSWNDTLGPALGRVLPKDPINKLGECIGFDPITCWNEGQKKFVTDFVTDVLPANSFAFVYTWDNANRRYQLCTNFETSYDGLPKEQRCDAFVDVGSKSYPVVTLSSAISAAGPFNTYLAVKSFYPIDWAKTEITPIEPASWASWTSAGWQFESGSAGLKLGSTGVTTQKRLSATNVKLPSGQGFQNFRFSVKVFDIRNNYGLTEGAIRICQPQVCETGQCGALSDNCGATLLCGDCPSGQTCANNKCIN